MILLIGSESLCTAMCQGKAVHSTGRESNWRPISDKLVPEAKFSPDSVVEYLDETSGRQSDRSMVVMAVRQHLLYLGWRMEFTVSGNQPRVRYFSPGGNCYYSLKWVCQNLREPTVMAVPALSYRNQTNRVASPTYRSDVPEDANDDVLHLQPAYCPEAVVDYCELELEKSRRAKGTAIEALRLKTKQHLLAVGWTFSYRYKPGRRELVYLSPSKKRYISLRIACKACIDEDRTQRLTGGKEEWMNHIGKPSERGSYSTVGCITIHKEALPPEKVVESFDASSQGLQRERWEEQRWKSQNVLSRGQDISEQVTCSNFELPKSKSDASFLLNLRRSSTKLRNNGEAIQPARLLRSSKTVQQIVPCSFQQNPRNLISWLVDNQIVLPRAKVYCRADAGSHNLAEGRIHRDGIKCICCNGIFTLSGFNYHVGSIDSRPSARIFLEDQRSLLDCQMQILQEQLSCLGKDPDYDRYLHENDCICSVCNDGGELMLCDQCASSFHTSCLGLDDVPDGDWYCPSCCCRICGQSNLNTDSDNSSEFLTCCQCERKYHIECLRERKKVEMEDLPAGNWYCSMTCEKISVDLSKLLGKTIRLGDNLTWTLLKFGKPSSQSHCTDTPDFESSAENYVRLKIACDVMHECFEPVKESFTKRDIVEDVILSRGSKLNRLNFRGFCTVVLEKNEEMVTVANVRIHGDKVAELPLIGTRFKFRRLGMCRILMNELERNLKDLGVKRLVLPAVASVLNTWTTSFGFTTMTEPERLQFLDYTFLDFQGTIMCQKHLLKIPSVESMMDSETVDYTKENDEIDMEDARSVFSEEVQADSPPTRRTLDQGLVENATLHEDRWDNCRVLKCYKRRKFLPKGCNTTSL